MLFNERKEFRFISKALPEDTFSVMRFRGTEAISRPFEFDITLASEDPEIDLKAVLRNPATLTITCGDGELPFHGVTARFEQLHEVKQHAFYRAILVPKLWNAGLYRENRIFLDRTVPQILEEMLKQAGMAGPDYELNLTRSYPAWEYICQYQETDLDFISRWMEREGMYYFFAQTDQGAKMVLSDNLSIHKNTEGDSAIPYSPPSGLIPSEKDIVREFVCRRKALPAKVILKDYNYRKPGLEVKAEAEIDPSGRGEVCIYGEHFKDPEQGKELAKIRAEEFLCRETEFYGAGTAPAFSPGFLFELTGHYRSEYDRKFLLTEVTHEGSRAADLLTGLGEEGAKTEKEAGYSNRFVCIPSDIQFRPERRTPRPKFYGAMNARVDAAGDGKYAELDEQGRYKVILPFDLSGRKDGKASRFMRMAQPYSGFTAAEGGKGPSGMHFPLHKGAEVLLTFVDGDPDRPIISSSIPNPETVSPVVQSNQAQSVIRDNFGNEIVFDTTPGDEHIRLYSPHHNSGLELGRSMLHWSASDSSQFSAGNNWGVTIGNKLDFTFGSVTEVKVGFVNSVVVGYNIDFICGVKHSINYALDLKSNYEPVVQCSKKDILIAAGKDQVLTAGDQVCIISGDSSRKTDLEDAAEKAAAKSAAAGDLTKKRREGQAAAAKEAAQNEAKPSQETRENRSIINVFPEKMILSVGSKQETFKIDNVKRVPGDERRPEEIFTKTPPQKELTQYSVISAAITAASGMTSEIPQDQVARGVVGGILGGLTGVLGIWLNFKIRKWAKTYTNDEAIEPVGHKDPAAKIEMDHQGRISIHSKENSILLRIGKSDDSERGAGILLNKDAIHLGREISLDGKVSLSKSRLKLGAGENVYLIAEDDLGIQAKDTVTVESKLFRTRNGALVVKS